MESTLLTAAAQLGVAPFLALIIFYWYRQDTKESLVAKERNVEREREDKIYLLEALERNTQVLTELTTLVKKLNGKSS